MQTPPRDVQLGARLARSAPLTLEKLLPIESPVPCEHVIDRTGQFLGQHRQRFALAMFFLYPCQGLLARRIVAQKQHGGFRERPLQIGIADLGT